jgi:hypothetical protein
MLKRHMNTRLDTEQELRDDTSVSSLVVSDSRREGGGHHQGQSPASAAGTPFCYFCIEGVLYRPEDGPADIATVRFDGKWACSFHSAFHFGDLPAKRFLAGDVT